jgi:hypothetical protein
MSLHAEKYQWVTTCSGVPFLPLHLEMPWREMLAEATALQNLFVQHRYADESHSGWKSLCIHGIDATSTQSHEHYGCKSAQDVPYRWTDINAPVTREYFREVYPASRYYRVRFMLLEPGGRILPHRDYPKRRLGPVNIALSHPPGCVMTLDQQVVPFRPGRAFLLDVSREHCVENHSTESRIHIIVHAEYKSAEWQAMVVKMFENSEHFQNPPLA